MIAQVQEQPAITKVIKDTIHKVKSYIILFFIKYLRKVEIEIYIFLILQNR